MAYPAFPLESHWSERVPTASGGSVPNWGADNLNTLILTAFRNGAVVTYIDGNNDQYILNAVTGSEFRFNGKILFNTPNSDEATLYRIAINRSTGAVTSSTKKFKLA